METKSDHDLMSSAVATVLYDADCAMCRNLAELAARRAGAELAFDSWQAWQSRAATAGSEVRPADRLRLVTDKGAMVEGEEAWAILVEMHPDLAALDWMAAKLGLSTGVARTLMNAGALLRRFCSRCGRVRRQATT